MAEQEFLIKIVEMITDHWDVFKYVFLGLGLKYIGQGFFQITKAVILSVMGIKKIFFNKD